MQLLDQININRNAHNTTQIQLLQGDLTAIPKEHATDILILSAYPGSYVPVPRTLIAALYNKGIDVAQMAKDKAIDLRDQLGCWLSQPLSGQQQEQFNFKRILCFEPCMQTNDQAAVVGNIFRCINTFAFNENNNVIAMPVLASGKQRVPVEKMLPALLDASIFWMESGLPITCIKLVLFSEEQAAIALPVFIRARQQNELKQSVRNGNITGTDALKMLEIKKQEQLPGEESMQIVTSEIAQMAEKEKDKMLLPPRFSPPAPAPAQGAGNKKTKRPLPPAPPPAAARPAAIPGAPVSEKGTARDIDKTPAMVPGEYDYFVSYAHKHAEEVEAFVKSMEASNKNICVFYDKSSIPAGGLWIKQISDAIQKSKKVLVFLSPDYSASMVCWDEFQCAKLIEYNSKKQIIQTIYLYNDAAMPPIMGIYSWADCREGDKEKLQKIAASLVS